MHKKFDHKAIEQKWQGKWRTDGLYDVGERNPSQGKEYVLVEWPYPSGNLHIGHWYAFAIPDIYVRAQRMRGKQVLFPIGFDAFGLPAENAAIKRGLDPKAWTDENIVHMKGQLESMGNAFSWDKTTSSIDPDYYKWTQVMFTKFFENDIAYRGTGMVNWCPGCHTVIANEQVLSDGTCERSGDVIEKKEMPQWMLRITKYADSLIDDLEPLNWPEHIKDAQRNWIGRSRGAEIDFDITFKIDPKNNEWRDESGKPAHIKVFTTRPDTLFGATYMVLAPEHPWVAGALQYNRGVFENADDVEAYVKSASQKDEMERTNATKEKTGVELKGVKAINPANGEEIPMFIADYVLGGYGTGAIMAVPAHDERDWEFAKQFKLPIKQVIKTPDEYSNDKAKVERGNAIFISYGELINSGDFDGMDSEEAKEAIVKKVGGKMTSTYRLRDWSIGRQRYWGTPIPIVYDREGNAHAIPEEHLPWLLPTDVDFTPTGEAPLAKSAELKERTERIFGEGWTPEVETMDTFVDSSWYFLRYIDNKNSSSLSSLTAQKDWMQVDTYFGGAEHTTMHLLYSRFWQKALVDLGLAADSEPYVKRINRGLVLGPDGNKMSKSKGNVIDPDEQVERLGADTVKMFLAFMGPYGEVTNYPWDVGGIAGIRRFLERVNGLRGHVKESEPESITKLLHKTIKKVGEDIEIYKFNTAISSMMIFVNAVEKEGLSNASYKMFLTLLAPFAPHLTEELWHEEGESGSIHEVAFLTHDAALVKDDLVTIGVQINGKVRGDITISPEATEEEALVAVRESKSLQERLEKEEVKKIIYRPGKILNILV